MDFKLKNYTTSISAEKSVSEIESLLSSFGANAVMKEYYSDGRVKNLAFKLSSKAYRLPANIDGVYNLMFKDKRINHRRDAMKKRESQSYRVAWRILRDWVHSQLSLIASGQSNPEEIMLPFMFDGERTLYQAIKEGKLQIEKKVSEVE